MPARSSLKSDVSEPLSMRVQIQEAFFFYISSVLVLFLRLNT